MGIKYRTGYKYQLAEDYKIKTDIIGITIDLKFIKLTPIGVLTIKNGYAWDGASGPTIDTKNSMRGSLIHDALYQLMRHGLLPQKIRKYADELLTNICTEDGMNKTRAYIWGKMTSEFAEFAADPKNKKEVIEAP